MRTKESNNEGASNANPIAFQSDQQEESIIVLQPLTKYISDFMKEVDSIPNPYNRPTIYTVSFLKHDNDTIIEIAGSISARLVKDESKLEYASKGGGYINERPVIIYDYIEGIGTSCYNQKELDQEFASDFIYSDSLDLMTTSWTYVPPTIKLKILNSRTIEMLENKTGNGKYNFYQ